MIDKEKIKQNSIIIGNFFWRDFKSIASGLKDYTLNYMIISPLIFNTAVGFLQAPIYFSQNPAAFATRMIPGNLLIFMMSLTFRIAYELLFDLEHDRFILYQTLLINPRILLSQRIFFGALYTFCSIAPFFFIAKIALGTLFLAENASWIQLLWILFLGSLAFSAYHFCAVTIISINQISTLWIRVNFFMIMLGRIPLAISKANQYSLFLSWSMHINPASYFIEGIHRSLSQSHEFFSITICSFVLLSTTLICTIISWHKFQKRIDHV